MSNHTKSYHKLNSVFTWITDISWVVCFRLTEYLLLHFFNIKLSLQCLGDFVMFWSLLAKFSPRSPWAKAGSFRVQRGLQILSHPEDKWWRESLAWQSNKLFCVASHNILNFGLGVFLQDSSESSFVKN